MCTKFGVNSSSRFAFRARTNRQTNRQMRQNALPTPAAIQPAWVETIPLQAHLACTWIRTQHENSLHIKPNSAVAGVAVVVVVVLELAEVRRRHPFLG